MSERRATWVVTEDDAGERADVVLGRRIPGLSRRVARNLARAGALRIDDRRAPPSTRVSVGARLELDYLDEPDTHATEREALDPLDQLHVVAETERFIYVCKPAGVHTIALTPKQPGVLATAVAARFPECADASPDPREGGAVHRLDLPTSGVVAFARSRATYLAARAGFGEARVAKHYLAVSRLCVHAWPPSLPDGGLQGWIDPTTSPIPSFLDPVLDLAPHDRVTLEPVRIRAPLGADGPTRSRVRLDGRRATSVIVPLARNDAHQLSYVLLETGRRHQARVHLAWVGLPIRGDTTYAPESESESGAAPQAIDLHAVALDLSAVFASEQLVVARPPAAFWPPSSAIP